MKLNKSTTQRKQAKLRELANRKDKEGGVFGINDFTID